MSTVDQPSVPGGRVGRNSVCSVLCRAGGIDPGEWSRTAKLTFLATLAVFALLQAWRPNFFLTDDALSSTLPILHDVGSQFLNAKFPTHLEYVYGGNAKLLGSVEFLWVWHPLFLTASLIAASPLFLWTFDFLALFSLLVGMQGMAFAALVWAARAKRRISPLEATLVSVGYFTAYYTLCTGSSWPNFLICQSMLPFIFAGVLLEGKAGLAMTAAATWTSFYAGHPAPFFFSILGVGTFAAVGAVFERSPRMVLRLAVGTAIGIAVFSPLLVSAFLGFGASSRAAGFVEHDPCTVPLINQALGGVFGVLWPLFTYATGMTGKPVLPFFLEPLDMFWGFPHAGTPFFFSIGGLVIALAFLASRRWKELELAVLCGLGLMALLVARPAFVESFVSSVPVLRSMRLPVRETMQVLFFAFILTAGRLGFLLQRTKLTALLAGTALFAMPLLMTWPPTLNELGSDRSLLLTGTAQDVWTRAYQMLDAPRDVPVVPYLSKAAERTPLTYIYHFPNSLAAGYNFPSLLGIKSVSGYYAPGLERPFHGFSPPFVPGYLPNRILDVAPEIKDSVLWVEVESFRPWAIRMRYQNRAIAVYPDQGGSILVAPIDPSGSQPPRQPAKEDRGPGR